METFEIGQSDFQLTITGSDGHVTKLTVTPTSNTGYWQAFAGLSAVFDALFGQEMANQFGETHSYLIFTYVYSSANVKLEYDGTTLLDGTISLNFSGKAADSMVYMNTPHTAAYAFTLYPQDNKDYTVGFDLTRETKSNGSNSVSRTVASKLYRKGSTNMTLFDVNAGMNATVTDGSTRPSAANLTAFDMNIADRIRIAESSTLDLVSLMRLYATGNSASEETVRSNAASMNTLLSNAGLSVYLNNSTGKAGDIRALAGKFGAYNHVRLGVQFVGESEPELVRDIANPDDLKQLRTLIGNVAPQVQALAQLLMSTGLMGDVTGNDIVQLIFEDLFGTN